MHLTQTGDIFVPQDEWESLVRISQIEGYTLDRVVRGAATEALLRADRGFHFDIDPEVVPDGVILRATAPEAD